MRKKLQPAVRDAIEATADKHGAVTPEGVVDAARDPKNPLHGEFEWNDKKAAHEQRLDTARMLIRSIEYLVADVTLSTRDIVYVHDPLSASQRYIRLDTAIGDRVLAREIALAEVARVESAIERLRSVARTLKIGCSLDQLEASVAAFRVCVEATAPRKRRKAA